MNKHRYLTLAVCGIVSVATPCQAEEYPFTGPYFGSVVRVVDGDTFEAKVELWPTISSTVSVRLKNFDAPELFRPACEEERLQATLAKAAMEELLATGQIVVLENVEPDSFSGRVVADIFRLATERKFSLNILLERREAIVPWDPDDEPIDWCK